MADVHSKEVRSYNMSQIKGKNTKPEMLIRKFLHAHGYRFRLHVKDLPGKPDVVLPKFKTVIFVHGCFWHGHEGCKYASLPQTKKEWWQAKIMDNKSRDQDALQILNSNNWRIITIWSCKLKGSYLEETLNNLLENLV